MAGIADTTTIDLVAEDADGTIAVVLTHTGPWDVPGLVPALREKLNVYAGFVLDGGLLSRYPEAAERRVSVRLSTDVEPPTEVQDVLEQATIRLAEHGIVLELAVGS